MALKGIGSAISKTNTAIGAAPPPRSHGLGGGKAGGTSVDKSGTASNPKSNLKVGAMKPKP